MVTRFKLIAAALGLVVAAGTIGDASARTIVKKTVITRSAGHVVRVAPRFHHRVVVLNRRPVLHRFVGYRAPVLVRAPILLKGHRHLMAHRTVITKTIIR